MSRLFLVLLGSSCSARSEPGHPVENSATPWAADSHLRQVPESFLVLGDADSFAWPALLQDLLDEHAHEPGLYRVLNGSIEARGIRPWRAAAGAAAARAVPRVEPAPQWVLCVVSPFDLTDPIVPEAGAPQVDPEAERMQIERGADALEGLARELHAAGIATVAFATPLHSPDSTKTLFEGLTLATLFERGLAFVAAGPDLASASRRYWPDAFTEEGGPNEFGIKLMAEEWYRWLAGSAAREEAVQALYARAYDVRVIATAHAASRSAEGP